jgi:hypothetical protein
MKDLVIKSIVEKLLVKGFESILRKDKEGLSNANRQLTENVSYLEKALAEKKTDLDSERTES